MLKKPGSASTQQLRWLTYAYTRAHHPDLTHSDWDDGDYLPHGHPAHTFDALEYSFISRYCTPLGTRAAAQILSRRTRELRMRRLVRRWGLVPGATVGSLFLGLPLALVIWLLAIVLGLVSAAGERRSATRIAETLLAERIEPLLETLVLQSILRQHLGSVPAATLTHPDWGACLLSCVTGGADEHEMLRLLAEEFDGSVQELQVTVALLTR